MVFHRNLSDNKCPQVSRTLLSILTDLNNAVVWTVSTHPLISKSSSPLIHPSVTVTRAPITIGINVTFMFHSFINFLTRFWYLSFFSLFSILLCGQMAQQSPQFCKFSFFFFVVVVVDYYKIWSSGRDYVIRLYVKVPEEFVCLII